MFISTRDLKEREVSASNAILSGLAPDGGLYIKKDIKKFDTQKLKELSNLKYQDLAFVILKEFLDDYSDSEIKRITSQAYDSKFDTENIINVKKVKDAFFMELYHGPALAFKDVALSALPLMIKEKNDQKSKTIILTATSGDTGSAALYGFSQDPNTLMIVFYPTKGVSKIQEKQMLMQANKRQRVIAIDGNFDDAQKLVKKIFNDPDLVNYSPNYKLSSANSINIGRLIPQVVYYFASYFDLVKTNEIKLGDEINFVVPTGNFGNILAGYIAKKMGLPVNKFICASNKNNVLTDFFNEKIYDKNREFYKTSSPSMDILVSSNLERLLYYITKDSSVVKGLMNKLDTEGKYELDNKYVINDFVGEYVNEEEVSKAIKLVYDNNKYLIDTHTAVGYYAYLKYLNKNNDQTKTIIASTAHPYKFPKTIAKAIGLGDYDDEFKAIDELVKYTNIEKPEMIKKLSNEYNKIVWSKEEAYNKAKELIKELNYE